MEENSHSTEDFRVFSLSIELITLIYGLFMVIWAFSISIIAESSSLTSLVPAFIGFPLILIGYFFLLLGIILVKKSISAGRNLLLKVS